MAESEAKQQPETVHGEEKRLKYLDFVQVAAIYVIVCFSSLYEYAKENSGPLKPGVQTVEGTVKTVIGPVYEKFYDVPFELLMFVDRKVEASIYELERHVPSLVKRASCQAITVAQKAPELALAPTAKELCSKYEPVAEQYAVSAWRSLNRLPLFPQVAQVVVPTAAYWSEKYNQSVSYTAERGYTVALYLPLIPTERIAKVFEEASALPTVETNGNAIPLAQ
ncbi:unnamed protein product, partial [Vitis vinifera]